MTDPRAPTPGASPPDEPAPPPSLSPASRAPRPGEPAPPGSFDGRARSFRERQADRRSARRQAVGAIFVVAVIALGVYTVLTARPYSSSAYQLPSPGPLITVHLGTPSTSTITCSAGGTAYVERIPFSNATQPIATGNVFVRVSEIWDGDFIGDPGVVANATPSNLCAGVAPDATSIWYVVLAAPGGTNLLTYTVARGWAAVTHGSSNVGIQNDSTIILLTYTSLAGTGRGLSVVGTENGSLIRGVVPL